MKQRVSLICTGCGQAFPIDENKSKCELCGGLLEFIFDEDYIRNVNFTGEIRFWRYKPILPYTQRQITLGEGGTPLQKSHRLAEALKLPELYFKDETRNPTNSFKDRSASLIVSDALGKGYSSLVCATNGNHGASIAAYSAKADLDCHLIVPKEIDLAKLAQMMVYDAQIIESGDSIEETIMRARVLEKEMRWYQATTELNPLSLEALKTISYEIEEQGGCPDYLVIAMGSGVTISALWKGYKELMEMRIVKKIPKLVGVQAIGCSPIVSAWQQGLHEPSISKTRATEASAIRVAEPIYGEMALRAIRESNGFAVTVSDEDMITAGREIARMEGIFAEPASASTVACLKDLIIQGIIDKSERVACLITSSGLKTDDILQSLTKRKRTLGLSKTLTTKEKILKQISFSETYGYAVWKSIGKGMTIGAIYQHIADLEKKGLVISVAKGKRRYYEITERGKKVLLAMADLQDLL